MHFYSFLLPVKAALRLLLSTNFEMFASFDGMHVRGFATLALETQHDLLGRFGFLVEHWLRLTSISRLLSVVTTFTYT